MRSEDIPVKEAFLRIAALKKIKKIYAYMEFTCDFCQRKNRVPDGVTRSKSIQCGKCKGINYLGLVRVITDENTIR